MLKQLAREDNFVNIEGNEAVIVEVSNQYLNLWNRKDKKNPFVGNKNVVLQIQEMRRNLNYLFFDKVIDL